MSKKINGLIIFLMFLIAVSCKKDPPVVPPPIVQIDTTSHAINWSIDDIGEYGSILRDVAIIDENNIWAVGEIYLKDSLGNPDPQAYNAVHWNGQSWVLKQIEFYTFCPQGTGSGYYPASSVFAFDEENIVISSGSQIAYLKNGVQEKRECIPVSVYKIWGSVLNDFYIVGYGGGIAHYNNSSWTKIASGTDINLRDVWGSPDGSLVWAAGFEDSYGTVLLRKTGNAFEKVLEITDPNIPHTPGQITHVFKSLWTDKTDTVYLGAIGRIYSAPNNTTGNAKENIWWDYANQTELPPETNAIRGTAGNDIFVAGFNQFVKHWNGKSWKGYPEIEGDGEWRSLAVNENIIIAVGINFSAPRGARIALGYRTK